MKQIIRQIDETGRIVVPKPFREILGVNLKDNLVMSLGENEIILRKAGTECSLCGGEGIIEYRGILLCKNCVDDIATRAKD